MGVRSQEKRSNRLRMGVVYHPLYDVLSILAAAEDDGQVKYCIANQVYKAICINPGVRVRSPTDVKGNLASKFRKFGRTNFPNTHGIDLTC